MQRIDAIPSSARTYFVHALGNGLDGEVGIVVERFEAMLDGDIRAIQPEALNTNGRSKATREVVSRKEVEAMRPARTEIIMCTGLRTKVGRQIWGDLATRLFHDCL